jgi:hypothetical protein
MKKIIWILFTISFIVASTAALKVTTNEKGEYIDDSAVQSWFIPALALCFFCGAAFSLSKKDTNADESDDGESVSPLHFLGKITNLMEKIGDARPTQEQLEQIQAVCLHMAGERFNYMQDYGIQDFSLFFEPFSNGERYTNRSWSALVDKYYEESFNSYIIAKSCFEKAFIQFKKIEEIAD